MSKEILTIQLGHYANFVGTHWWNLQEATFEYNSTKSSNIDHGVLFREGLTSKGSSTFTPRLLLADLKGSLHSLLKEGDLYDFPSDPKNIADTNKLWENKVEVLQETGEQKNEFQEDINNPKTLPLVPHKKYNLDENVKVWSDYLYTRFHPRSVNVINEYSHNDEHNKFDTFTLGRELWNNDSFNDEFSDKIRIYVEECDYFQGFHIITDCSNGFAGLSSACLEHLQDEYDNKSILVLPVIPSFFTDNNFETDIEHVHSIMNDSIRVLNYVLSFNCYSQFADMFVPLCTSEYGWRQPGEPRKFYHTNYNHKLPYHSSAILASALDAITLKYRLKASQFSLPDLCKDLTFYGRKAVAASICLPFSFNSDAHFIDCLDQWEGPLTQSITPRCAIGSNRMMQHITLRGIPETRLKNIRNAEKQKNMAAYKYNTVKEMLEFYLSCNTYATASSVFTMEKPMPVQSPFPDSIFDSYIGINGNIIADSRAENTKVTSIPIMAGFHCGKETGGMLESLYAEARKLKIARFHRFNIEKDEYETCLNDILTLMENYENN